MPRPFSGCDEPTPADLTAIEVEWPLIEAELAALDADIVILSSDTGPTDLDWQRWRRAQRRVLREARALLTVLAASDRTAA